MAKDKKKNKEAKINDSVKTGDDLNVKLQPGTDTKKDDSDLEKGEGKNNNEEENAMAKDKDKDNETKEEKEVETVKMIWLHKTETPGQQGTVFGFPAVADEEGHFVVEVPRNMVKNEMKRVQTLIPYDLYLKRKALEDEAKRLYK